MTALLATGDAPADAGITGTAAASGTTSKGTTERPTGRLPRHLRVAVRPAPRREPPFDDERRDPSPVGVYDRHLPFAAAPRQSAHTRAYTCPYRLPEPASWGRRLLIGLIEASDGRRPLHQLSALLSMSIIRGLRQDFEQPTGRSTQWLGRGSVRSVIACRPADGVAELAATIETGNRIRAVALRLEERQGRWCCTRLQLG